jgi:hypothetical protein
MFPVGWMDEEKARRCDDGGTALKRSPTCPNDDAAELKLAKKERK